MTISRKLKAQNVTLKCSSLRQVGAWADAYKDVWQLLRKACTWFYFYTNFHSTKWFPPQGCLLEHISHLGAKYYLKWLNLCHVYQQDIKKNHHHHHPIKNVTLSEEASIIRVHIAKLFIIRFPKYAIIRGRNMSPLSPLFSYKVCPLYSFQRAPESDLSKQRERSCLVLMLKWDSAPLQRHRTLYLCTVWDFLTRRLQLLSSALMFPKAAQLSSPN